MILTGANLISACTIVDASASLVNTLLALGTAELLLLSTRGITTAAGPVVTAWADQSGNANDWASPIPGDQPDFDPADANLNGKPSLFFDTTERLISQTAKINYRFTHNGTGCTMFFVLYPAAAGGGAFVDSMQTNPGLIGVELLRSVSNGVQLIMANASGTFVINRNVTGVLIADTPSIVTVRHKTGETDEYNIRVNGSSVAVGSFVGTPSASDSAQPLTLGTIGGVPAAGYDGDMAAVPMYSEYMTVSSMAAAEAALAAEYGVTL